MVGTKLEEKYRSKIEAALKEYFATEEKLWDVFKGKEIPEWAVYTDKDSTAWREYDTNKKPISKKLSRGEITRDEYYDQTNKLWGKFLNTAHIAWAEFVNKRKTDARMYLRDEMRAWYDCNKKILSVLIEFIEKGISTEVEDKRKEERYLYEFINTEEDLNTEHIKRREKVLKTFIDIKKYVTL